jgi:hypothetical protein
LVQREDELLTGFDPAQLGDEVVFEILSLNASHPAAALASINDAL